MWAWLKDSWENGGEGLADSLADIAALASLMGLIWVMLAWGVLLDMM